MKVALTTSGTDLGARLDTRFGRAPRFLIYDTDAETFELIDNEQNLNAMQGAGVQSAEAIARVHADCLITGHCGPKAFRVLKAAGVRIFTTEAATVSEALAAFGSGDLTEATASAVDSHW